MSLALRPRQPCLGLAVAASLGVAAAEYGSIPALDAAAAASACLLAWVAWRHTSLCWIATWAAFFALHTLGYRGSESHLLADRLGSGPHAVRAEGIVWSEPEAPKTWSRFTKSRFTLKLDYVEADGMRVVTGSVVQVKWAAAPPSYGDRVQIVASWQTFPPVRNEGQFDWPLYERRQGVCGELLSRYPSDCRVLSHRNGSSLQAFSYAAQHWICRTLELDLENAPEISSLVESMILGMRGDTPEEMKELFQRTGTMHLFAVSGLNVAMLVTLLWFLLKPMRVSRAHAVSVLLPVILGYALITGWSASCLRATIMGGAVLLGYVFDRRASPLNTVAASALTILACDTTQLFSAGFQFSFVLVIVLVCLAGWAQRQLGPLGLPDSFLPRPLWGWRHRWQAGSWSFLAGSISVSTVSWAGSLVFTIGYFHLFAPCTVFANLLAVPISFAILALGVAAVLSAPISSGVAILFNNANWFCAKLLLGVVHFFAALPGGYVYLSGDLSRSPTCAFTVLDVGTGGAIHLRTPPADWMIDCAHGFDYERVVLPYLRSRGVNRLDGLLLTHGDVQHIGGATSLLDDFHPRLILDSSLKDRSATRRALHNTLAERRWPKRAVARGDEVEVSPGVRLAILFPPQGWARSSADDKALVFRLEATGHRVLFTSDSGYATERWLIENEPDLDAELLVKGEHAKDLSGTADFLQRVHPRAIICTAAEPQNGVQKRDVWAAEVERAGIALFCQEKTGEVAVTLRNQEICIQPFFAATRKILK